MPITAILWYFWGIYHAFDSQGDVPFPRREYRWQGFVLKIEKSHQHQTIPALRLVAIVA